MTINLPDIPAFGEEGPCQLPPEFQALIWSLRGELLQTARVFLEQEAGLELPDWMALKDAADDLARLCVHDSLDLAWAQAESGPPAA